MFGIGWTEILVILVVALLVLGPDRLPGIARSLGKGLREFRRTMHSLEDEESPPRPAGWTAPVPPRPPEVPAPPANTAQDTAPEPAPPEDSSPEPSERTDSRRPG